MAWQVPSGWVRSWHASTLLVPQGCPSPAPTTYQQTCCLQVHCVLCRSLRRPLLSSWGVVLAGLQIPDSQKQAGSNHAVSALKFRILTEFIKLGYAVLLSGAAGDVGSGEAAVGCALGHVGVEGSGCGGGCTWACMLSCCPQWLKPHQRDCCACCCRP